MITDGVNWMLMVLITFSLNVRVSKITLSFPGLSEKSNFQILSVLMEIKIKIKAENVTPLIESISFDCMAVQSLKRIYLFSC